MLALRPSCEHCQKPLPPNSDEAQICTYECTFCTDCATWVFLGICPNCDGELVVRPRRPADRLVKHPAAAEEVHNDHDLIAHENKVLARLQSNDLPRQVWTVAFANGRREGDDGYSDKGAEMELLAMQQPGFIGVDSVRGADGVGITVSRWSSVAAMVAWRKLPRHAAAQSSGRAKWYEWYRSDVARVVRVSQFSHDTSPNAHH
jgi:uncharacterized protein